MANPWSGRWHFSTRNISCTVIETVPQSGRHKQLFAADYGGEMNQTLAVRRKLWPIALWLGVIGEGLWFFVAFTLASAPYPYQLPLLLLLWIILVLCMLAFKQQPLLVFIAACINLVGCALIKSRPGGVAHPWLWFVYYHLIDVVIVIATFAIWQQKQRRQ
jgi:hypothetical protein